MAEESNPNKKLQEHTDFYQSFARKMRSLASSKRKGTFRSIDSLGPLDPSIHWSLERIENGADPRKTCPCHQHLHLQHALCSDMERNTPHPVTFPSTSESGQGRSVSCPFQQGNLPWGFPCKSNAVAHTLHGTTAPRAAIPLDRTSEQRRVREYGGLVMLGHLVGWFSLRWIWEYIRYAD